jgi:hypothetical protein
MQDDTVKIRTLEEIMKEAKNNFALTKDKRKMEKDSTKYGQLRPIFTSLVQEIFAEEAEKQRIIDEREENEVESLVSDGMGGRVPRPSRISSAARKRRTLQQRPRSATATSTHRSSHHSRQQHSQEAPSRLQGDRATILHRASQHNVDPITGMPTNRRHELVPIKSVDVLAMNTLENELSGQAHGRISRTQRELMQHVKNGKQMQVNPTASNANNNNKPTPLNTTPSTNNSNADSPNKSEPDFASSPTSGKFRTHSRGNGGSMQSPYNGNAMPSVPEEDTAVATFIYPDNIEPAQAAENLVWMMKLGKAVKTLERAEAKRELLLPSQMVLQTQKSVNFGAAVGGSGGDDEDNDDGRGGGKDGVKMFAALREQASFRKSSYFSTSAVKDDEKISKVLSQREEIMKVSGLLCWDVRCECFVRCVSTRIRG